MIDVDNYKRAVAWMKRNLLALEQTPDDKVVQDATMQSFEVTFNLSEQVLRKGFVSLNSDEADLYLSFREIIYRAEQEGLLFTSNKHWLEYGAALESLREAFLDVADVNIDTVRRVLLMRYVEELESFALNLERRLAARV